MSNSAILDTLPRSAADRRAPALDVSTGERILVSDGDERCALAIVRALGRAGKQDIVVCSRRGRSLAGASRFARNDYALPDPLSRPAAFAAGLAELARSLGITTLIPVSEASLLAVLSHREVFAGILLPFTDEESFRQVSNKRVVIDAARRIGITVPSQHSLSTASDVEPLLESGELRFPIVVKPSRSVATHGDRGQKFAVRHAANGRELRENIARFSPEAFPLLLQQRIVGPGVGIFLLRWDGKTVAAFSHRRLREKPPAGGVSVYSESVPVDSTLLAQSEALLDHFAWRGIAMVEYKLDASSGAAYLMEINGRFWGSLQLAVTAGVNFPSLLLSVATGSRTEQQPSYRIGVRNRWWWGEVDHLIARLRRSNDELALPPGTPGRARAILDFLRWRLADHNELLQLDDPLPFLRETRLWFQGQ